MSARGEVIGTRLEASVGDHIRVAFAVPVLDYAVVMEWPGSDGPFGARIANIPEGYVDQPGASVGAYTAWANTAAVGPIHSEVTMRPQPAGRQTGGAKPRCS